MHHIAIGDASFRYLLILIELKCTPFQKKVHTALFLFEKCTFCDIICMNIKYGGRIMGLFDIFKKKETNIVISNEYLNLLSNYSRLSFTDNLNDITTHKKMIALLEKVISVVSYVTMPISIQNEMNNNELRDRSINEFCGEIAFTINKWLGVANIDNITKKFRDKSNDDMLKAFAYLDFYAHMLKEEYKKNIQAMQIEIAKEIKKRNIEIVIPEPHPQELSEFEKLQRKCSECSKSDPESEETKALKKNLWDQLLNQDAIWVTYDEDIAGDFPFIGLMGPMEIFTKEEYALAAQTYFAKNNEGHFSLRKIEKENIKDWFTNALYIGATLFNLDNGVAPVQFKIEDYIPYENTDIDYINRATRCYLLRALQAQNRYHKMNGEKPEDKTNMYNQIISALISNGYTALANSTVYALIDGPYLQGTQILSKAAFEKHKDFFNPKDSQTRQYMMKLDDELKIPAVANETVLKDMIASGNVTILTIEKIRGVQTIVIPNRGKFVPIFTDRAGAENMRNQFLKHGEEYDCNIVAVTFAEIIPSLLSCDGAIVDDTTFSYILPKATLENIKKQMESQKK